MKNEYIKLQQLLTKNPWAATHFGMLLQLKIFKIEKKI